MEMSKFPAAVELESLDRWAICRGGVVRLSVGNDIQESRKALAEVWLENYW